MMMMMVVKRQLQLLFMLLLAIHQVFTKALLDDNFDDDDDDDDDQMMADGKSLTATTTPSATLVPPVPVIPVLCQSPIDLTVDSSWLETVVFGDFRIWHIIFTGLAVFTGITVILCCFFRCRIPRTKQEIEADDTRKKITKVINAHLKKIKLDELQYDPANLLPVIKRVEDLEEDRVQKHRTFRRLNWRQKLKRLITGKDASFEDEPSDGEHKVGDGHAMTKEEMAKVEQEVESAKIDSTAFNVISDQIAVLSYFESDKTRKKRLREEEKERKKRDKEKKKQEKLEKKQEKKSKKKGKEGQSPAEKLVELKAATLEKDHQGNDDERTVPSLPSESPEVKKSPSPDITIDMPPPETEEAEEQTAVKEGEEEGTTTGKRMRFSFRGAVMGLMTRGFRRTGTAERSSKSPPVPVAPPPKTPSPAREAMVINIELVSKQPSTPTDEMVTVQIPHIEVPEDTDGGGEKSKHQKKHKLAKMKSMDKNRLHIPEVLLSKETAMPKKMEKKKKKKNKKKEIDEAAPKLPSELSKVHFEIEDRTPIESAPPVTEIEQTIFEEKTKTKKMDKDSKKMVKMEKEEKKKMEKEEKKKKKKEKKEKEKKKDKKEEKEKEAEAKPKEPIKKVIFVPEITEQPMPGDRKPGWAKKQKSSSSEIEIPVQHHYSVGGPVEPPSPQPAAAAHKTLVQVHRQQHRISVSPEPTPPARPPIGQAAFEQSTTVERLSAGTSDERRELTIEKTRNVMFDVATSSSVPPTPQPKPSKKVVKLVEMEKMDDKKMEKHQRKHRKKSP